jgi:hypothetical protein
MIEGHSRDISEQSIEGHSSFGTGIGRRTIVVFRDAPLVFRGDWVRIMWDIRPRAFFEHPSELALAGAR